MTEPVQKVLSGRRITLPEEFGAAEGDLVIVQLSLTKAGRSILTVYKAKVEMA